MSRRERIEAKLSALGFQPHPEAKMNARGGLEFARSDDWTRWYYALIRAKALVAWPLYRNHGDTAIASAREPVPWWSFQATLHRDGERAWAECDVDLGNADPRMGALPAVVHTVWDVGILSACRWLKGRFRGTR